MAYWLLHPLFSLKTREHWPDTRGENSSTWFSVEERKHRYSRIFYRRKEIYRMHTLNLKKKKSKRRSLTFFEKNCMVFFLLYERHMREEFVWTALDHLSSTALFWSNFFFYVCIKKIDLFPVLRDPPANRTATPLPSLIAVIQAEVHDSFSESGAIRSCAKLNYFTGESR